MVVRELRFLERFIVLWGVVCHFKVFLYNGNCVLNGCFELSW